MSRSSLETARVESFRIGEVARRTGTSTALLRAWETRYGLLNPARSPGGTRLYTAVDIARVRAMQLKMSQGLAAADAARAVLEEGLSESPATRLADPAEAGDRAELEIGAERLTRALMDLDRDGAESALDALLGWVSLDRLIADVIVPYLEDVGARWARGETAIAEEHLASNVLRTRLVALARRPEETRSAPLVLACPPRERHDLPLVILMALLRRSRSAVLLGADTPAESVIQAARATGAAGVVLAAMDSEHLAGIDRPARELSSRWPLFIAGAGASSALAEQWGAVYLDDLLTATASIEATTGLWTG